MYSWVPSGPGAQAGLGPKWARPKWARGLSPKWARGPGPKWARGPSVPGPK